MADGRSSPDRKSSRAGSLKQKIEDAQNLDQQLNASDPNLRRVKLPDAVDPLRHKNGDTTDEQDTEEPPPKDIGCLVYPMYDIPSAIEEVFSQDETEKQLREERKRRRAAGEELDPELEPTESDDEREEAGEGEILKILTRWSTRGLPKRGVDDPVPYLLEEVSKVPSRWDDDFVVCVNNKSEEKQPKFLIPPVEEVEPEAPMFDTAVLEEILSYTDFVDKNGEVSFGHIMPREVFQGFSWVPTTGLYSEFFHLQLDWAKRLAVDFEGTVEKVHWLIEAGLPKRNRKHDDDFYNDNEDPDQLRDDARKALQKWITKKKADPPKLFDETVDENPPQLSTPVPLGALAADEAAAEAEGKPVPTESPFFDFSKKRKCKGLAKARKCYRDGGYTGRFYGAAHEHYIEFVKGTEAAAAEIEGLKDKEQGYIAPRPTAGEPDPPLWASAGVPWYFSIKMPELIAKPACFPDFRKTQELRHDVLEVPLRRSRMPFERQLMIARDRLVKLNKKARQATEGEAKNLLINFMDISRQYEEGDPVDASRLTKEPPPKSVYEAWLKEEVPALPLREKGEPAAWWEFACQDFAPSLPELRWGGEAPLGADEMAKLQDLAEKEAFWEYADGADFKTKHPELSPKDILWAETAKEAFASLSEEHKAELIEKTRKKLAPTQKLSWRRVALDAFDVLNQDKKAAFAEKAKQRLKDREEKAASERPIFAGEVYDTDPLSLGLIPSPSAWMRTALQHGCLPTHMNTPGPGQHVPLFNFAPSKATNFAVAVEEKDVPSAWWEFYTSEFAPAQEWAPPSRKRKAFTEPSEEQMRRRKVFEAFDQLSKERQEEFAERAKQRLEARKASQGVDAAVLQAKAEAHAWWEFAISDFMAEQKDIISFKAKNFNAKAKEAFEALSADRKAEFVQKAMQKFAPREAAKADPIFISPHSGSYDISTVPLVEYLEYAMKVPALRHSSAIGFKSKAASGTFEKSPDMWDRFRQQYEVSGGEAAAAIGDVANAGAVVDVAILTEGAAAVPGRPGREQKPFYGVRIRDIKDLIEANEEWFNSTRWCDFSKCHRKKTMYDVCPELIIPATVCQERIVTLTEEDIKKLKPVLEGGILFSAVDLTIDPSLRTVNLGGVDIPAGLTFHGKLKKGGPIRQKYWAKGAARSEVWRTVAAHKRDTSDLAEVAAIPEDLPQHVPRDHKPGEPLDEAIGEVSDRVWTAGELEAGDTVVLRRGVSYIEMVAQGGEMFELDSFASHFWGEQTVDFLRTLEIHAQALVKDGGGDPLDRVYYVCTFNNNQHRVELGSSWKQSPFNNALEFVARMVQEGGTPRDAVMLFDETAAPLKRKWCVFEAWRCTELDLPLRLFCPDGEITRDSAAKNETAKKVLGMVAEIDLHNANCSVKADADMIDRAIEDAPGGFAAVHAKLRTKVLDLMTFIGSLAVSIDPVTGKKVREVELQVHGCAPAKVKGKVMETKDIAEAMCTGTITDIGLSQNVLLVAPAGSGKSVFSRALVRQAVEFTKNSGVNVLPVRVPLAELARVASDMRAAVKKELRQLAGQVTLGRATQAQFEMKQDQYNNMRFDALFDRWAERAFLRDAPKVTVDNPGTKKLLILDGFDEAGESRADLINWLRRYTIAHPDVAILLTTRPSGLDRVGMSVGYVREPRSCGVGNANGANWVSINEEFPLETAVRLKFNGEDETIPAVIKEEDTRLKLGDGVLKPMVNEGTMKFLSIVKPCEVTITLPDSEFGGKGGRVLIRTTKYTDAYRKWKEQTSGRHASRSREDALGVKDLLEIEVLECGSGYREGQSVRIPFECFTMESLDEVRARIEKLNNDPDKSNADKTELNNCETLKKHIEEWQSSKQDKVKKAEDQLLAQESQLRLKAQQLKDLQESQSQAQKKEIPKVEQEKKEVELKIESAKRTMQNMKEELVNGEDVRCSVNGVERYVAFSKNLNDTTLLDLDGKTLDKVSEMYIRDELVEEMGFSDCEIDTINEDIAAQICMSVAGDNLKNFDSSVIGKFPGNLWDRPLMANLFAQYLEVEGVEKARQLDSTVAELSIFRFIFEVLLKQAARTTAKDSKDATLQRQLTKIRKLLQDQSKALMNRNLRLWGKNNLSFLFEDAVRGHLRLFEPQQAEQKEDKTPGLKDKVTKMAQFYHYRLQELLAAEYWNNSDKCVERATYEMVANTALVQTGLAPLRFLIQGRLAVSANPRDLRLNFAASELNVAHLSYAAPVVTQMADFVPQDLDRLELKFPLFKGGRFPTLTTGVADDESDDGSGQKAGGALAIPPNVKHLCLDFNRTKLVHFSDPFGLAAVDKMESLEFFRMNLSGSPINEKALKVWAVKLPKTLKSLDLDLTASAAGLPVSAVLTALSSGRCAESLSNIDLNVSKWSRCCSTGGSEGEPYSMPPNLRQLRIKMKKVEGLQAQDVLQFFKSLPNGLELLDVNFRYSFSVLSMRPRRGEEFNESQKAVAEKQDLSKLFSTLPPSLKSLGVVFNRKISDLDVAGLAKDIPTSLEALKLDFRYETQMTDESLSALGRHLPPGLKRLEVSFALCQKITAAGINELSSGIGNKLEELKMSIANSLHIGDDGLVDLGKKLPAGLTSFSLNISSCQLITDAGLNGLTSQLPKSLKKLTLLMRNCDNITPAGFRGITAGSAAGLEMLTIDIRRCKKLCAELDDDAVSAFCSGLPQGLKKLDLDLEGCARFGDEALKAVGSALQSELEALTLNLTACDELTNASIPSLGDGILRKEYGDKQEISITFKNCRKIQTHELEVLRTRLSADPRQLPIDYDTKRLFGSRKLSMPES